MKTPKSAKKPAVKKAPAPKKVASKSAEPQCRATLAVYGKKFVGSGPTVLDAITALAPGNVHGRGILTVEKPDGTKRDRLITPRMGQRMFNLSGLAREIALKQISILF